MDMNDRTLVMVMTQGIGANLTNDEKRAHLSDLKRESLIDQVCTMKSYHPKDSDKQLRVPTKRKSARSHASV